MNPPVDYRKRTSDSARFSTYYKVQWFDATSLCWFDIQKQHASREDAIAAYLPGKQCRTMEVTPEDRRPL